MSTKVSSLQKNSNFIDLEAEKRDIKRKLIASSNNLKIAILTTLPQRFLLRSLEKRRISLTRRKF